MSPDLANGIFEFAGSLCILMHIKKLHKDKLVRGVHPFPVAVFALWGFWNMYYYPHLSQWWSFTGGCAIVAANVVWLGQMFFYIARERNSEVPYFGGKPPRSISIRETSKALRDQIRDFAADESSGGRVPFLKDLGDV